MATEGHASDIEPLCTDSEEAHAEANFGLVDNSVYEESDVLRVLWRLWLALVALSVTCAAVGFRYGTCEDGPPTVLYVIFGTVLAAMQVWQFRVAVTHTKLWHEGGRGNSWVAWYVFYAVGWAVRRSTISSQMASRLHRRTSVTVTSTVPGNIAELPASSLPRVARGGTPAHGGNPGPLPGPRSGAAGSLVVPFSIHRRQTVASLWPATSSDSAVWRRPSLIRELKSWELFPFFVSSASVSSRRSRG